MPLTLTLLQAHYAVVQYPADAALPAFPLSSELFAVIRTASELSIVCADTLVPPQAKTERGWRALRFEGPFDFALTGILASVAGPLATNGVPIFALSTFDTDYVLVKAVDLARATDTLIAAGHKVKTQ